MKNHKKLRNALATLLLALPLALQGAVGVKTAQAAETSTETATVTLHKYVFDKSLPSDKIDNSKSQDEINAWLTKNNAEALDGVEFTAYDVTSEYADAYKTATGDKNESPADAAKTASAAVAKKADALQKTAKVVDKQTTANGGLASFANLPLRDANGNYKAYLFAETDAPANITQKAEPFVLAMPIYGAGGKGKRTVIAAHRGLPERKLFTDLDKVKKGDLFVISVYGKNMAYKVYNIKVIKPNKVKSLLPVKDKDLATLMTCTPYMINSHRMLVTGYRVPYTKKIAREVEGASLMNNLIQAAVMLCCVMAIFSVFYILYRIIHGGLLKKREINLDFIVVDADGKPVVGEAFQLFAKNGRRKLYRNQKEFIVKSDEQGRVRFTNLPGNVYCIKNDHLSVRAGVKKLRQENAALYPKKRQKSFIAQDNEKIWIVKNHH